MTFPTLSSSPWWTIGNATTRTFTGNLPTTVNAGMLLLLYVHANDFGGDMVLPTAPTDSTGDAWTQLLASHSWVGKVAAIYYKIADGDEDSGTIDIVYTLGGTGEAMLTACHRVSASSWHGTTPPEIAVQDVTNDQTPDCPNLTPSWGAADTLWIAGLFPNQDLTGITGPTSYTFNTTEGQDWDQAGGGSGNAKLAVAHRELNTASQDPGQWGSIATSTVDSTTFTIGVRPPVIATGVPIRSRTGYRNNMGTL